MNLILAALIFSVLANLVMFVPAYKKQTDTLTDISYALTFVVLAIFGYSFSSGEFLHLVISAAVLLWACRLGLFLYSRIQRIKVDHRFDSMRSNPFKFMQFWLLQGITVFIVMFSCLLLWQTENTDTGLLSILGLFIFALGLGLETAADYQKSQFTKNPSNKEKWISSGVWSISRHPNYLGEMLVWSGLYVAVFSSLSSSSKAIGLLSPIYIIVLLLFVSGIPILEKSAHKKWGNNKTYQDYKKRVPVLLPKLFG